MIRLFSVDDSQANYLDVDGFGRSKLGFWFSGDGCAIRTVLSVKFILTRIRIVNLKRGLADVDGSGMRNSRMYRKTYYEGNILFTAGENGGTRRHYTGKTFQTVLLG